MSCCLLCKWNPATEQFDPAKHEECKEKNKTKDILDCDCQHRTPKDPGLVAGSGVLHPGGNSSTHEAEGRPDGDELAPGSEPSTDGRQDIGEQVASVEIIVSGLLEGTVR